MGRVALTVAAMLCLLLPASAAGAVRYASQTGDGTECSQGFPCQLGTAVGGASENDEVVVAAGIYELGGALAPAVPVTIHGVSGLPRPTIVAPDSSPVLDTSATLTLSDVTLKSTNASFTVRVTGAGSSMDRVEVLASGTGAAALQPGNGFLLRNSLLRVYGAGTKALYYRAPEPGTVTVRNVTAFASGPDSRALDVFAEVAPGASIDATNVIADAAVDLFADADPSTAAAINITNSNFNLGQPNQGFIGGPRNQPPLPLFANAAAGDFREAPGSPTIDAGLTDPANGALDLDGNPRTAGAATDIGAHEFLPPPPAGGAPVDTSAAGTVIGRLRLGRRGVITATLTCPAGESRCRWAYTLRSRRSVRTRGKRRVIGLGGGTASATGGKRVTIRIRLSKRNFRLIRRKRRLAVKLTVRTTDAAANVATTKRTATLSAPRRAARTRRAAP